MWNKGNVSVYGIFLLGVVLSFTSYFYVLIQQLDNSDYEFQMAEFYTILFIKEAYMEYEEEDVSLTYEDFDIEITYEGMLATASITKDNKKLSFELEFDDIEECVSSFEYIEKDDSY